MSPIVGKIVRTKVTGLLLGTIADIAYCPGHGFKFLLTLDGTALIEVWAREVELVP
jgi:hypothetical protein